MPKKRIEGTNGGIGGLKDVLKVGVSGDATSR